MTRLAAYLTSRRNLAGAALALVGAGLALADPVGLGGLALVIGFYLVGALAVPSKPAVRRYGFDPRQVQRAISDEISAVSGRVPPEVITRSQRNELTTRSDTSPGIDCLP